MRNVNRLKGFTLIELMIVISIIGVLAAIAIPNFRQAREKSNRRACYANQKTILGALEMYNLDYGESLTITAQAQLQELATKKYLQGTPSDPGCKKGVDNYQSDDVGNVWCKFHGNIEGDAGVIDGGNLSKGEEPGAGENAAGGSNKCS